jgi:dolichyl-phosphate beta-glucosyltransferase
MDSISIVIPAFNEAARISPTLRKVVAYLGERARDYEIIVVDDGSTDGTASIVMEESTNNKSIKLFQGETNRGKGHSTRRGVLGSSFGLVLISDADLSTPIEEVEKLLPWLESGCDIAIGSRALKDSDIIEKQPWYRQSMGRMFNLLVRTLVLGGIGDTQCGFKLFRANAAKKLFQAARIEGFAFDVEVLYLARKMGYRIKEVPIRWINSPKSKVRILSDSFLMFKDLIRVRLLHSRLSGRRPDLTG